jgi:hypothetical protein
MGNISPVNGLSEQGIVSWASVEDVLYLDSLEYLRASDTESSCLEEMCTDGDFSPVDDLSEQGINS